MLFNSYQFIFIFLPVTFALYAAVRRFDQGVSVGVLLIASLVFYGYFDVWNLPILILSTLANWTFFKLLHSRSPKAIKSLVIIAIMFNVLLLGVFKYYGFVAGLIFGDKASKLSVPNLPIAISFFTFQQISFIVDKSKAGPDDTTFVDYAAYITFFPHLLAGPIVRHHELIPQLQVRPLKLSMLSSGIFMFALGLAKKVLIADGLSGWVATGFAKGEALNLIDAWTLALSFTFQLYFDFSGYSDMAIGLALMFGFTIPENFNSPYRATSLQGFWRRWHMTLSRWLRDYLYIPLGGNQMGASRSYVNLVITMTLGGLWHGAGWTYVAWGLAHGLGLAVHRGWHKLGLNLGAGLGWLATFLFVVNAWVIFRAPDFLKASQVYKAMYGYGAALPPFIIERGDGKTVLDIAAQPFGLYPSYAVGVLVLVAMVALLAPNTSAMRRRIDAAPNSPVAVMLMAWAGAIGTLAVKRMLEVSSPSEFLYFQF